MGETILVVRADELKKHYDFQGFLPLSLEDVRKLYDSLNVLEMDRDKAEEDPTFKQLIAYSGIRSQGKYVSYLRGEDLGEARLHGNRSVGIGGHINSEDRENKNIDCHLEYAALREIEEEVNIDEKVNLHLAGLINDDSNAVGKVHLGLVYVADLVTPAVTGREQGIARVEFASPEELLSDRDQFETWSQILIDNISSL